MYLSRAASLAQNAAKLSRSTAESLVESAMDLSLDATSSSRFFDTPKDKLNDITNQLESRRDKDKLEALKRLVAMISKGRDVSEFFAQVVKNVASTNLEVRKLVYIYLLRYAEVEPDLALLSINTFQKDLADHNPVIRAMALRVMSGIRVPVISSIVQLGIKKCAADSSPYVRKTAALAIPKCYGLDSSQRDALVDVISQLLGDSSAYVIGSVITAFTQVCPDKLELLHSHYRKLCHMLPDVDEWGQIEILNLLLRYARTQFTNPKGKIIKLSGSLFTNVNGSNSDFDDKNNDKQKKYIDDDHALLLSSTKPLFYSRNAAVIIAATKVFFYAAPDSEMTVFIRPLLKLVRSPPEMQFLILTNIKAIVVEKPNLFQSFFTQFLVYPNDSRPSKLLKLDILTYIVTDSHLRMLLHEIKEYCKSPDRVFVSAAVQAIGKCAIAIPESTDICLSTLMSLVYTYPHSDVIVAEAVVIIHQLLKKRETVDIRLVLALVRILETIRVPTARASILSLVARNAESLDKIAPDVLRECAKSFPDEGDQTKMQIVSLATRLHSLHPDDKVLSLLFQYVMVLARYDLNYDLRDRTRFLKSLVGMKNSRGLGKCVHKIIFEQPTITKTNDTSPVYSLGTLSLSLAHPIIGYESLPDWAKFPSNPSIRKDREKVYVATNFGGLGSGDPQPARPKVYDDVEAFYDDDEDDEEDEEEEDDNEEDGSEGNDEEDDDEEEEEEEEEEDDDENSDDGDESSNDDDSDDVVESSNVESSDNEVKDDKVQQDKSDFEVVKSKRKNDEMFTR